MIAEARVFEGLRLAEILRGEAEIPESRDLPVLGLALDSRHVRPGYLFLACRGHDHHGLKHVDEARDRGAVAVAYDPEGAVEYLPALKGLPAFAVRALDQRVGVIAARFHADPSAAQQVVAVTGTNGKTSVSFMIAQMLTDLGKPSGLLGTLGYGLYARLEAPTHTTPSALSIQQWLARFRDRGVQYVSMEASSHALDQGRMRGVHVAVAVFTNLSRDHLDYHGNMENYAKAKRQLFDTPGLKHAIINLDDTLGRELIQTLPGGAAGIGYALGSTHPSAGKTVIATHIQLKPGGLQFAVDGTWGRGQVESRLLGRFNVQNLLAVLGALLALDIPFAEALRALGDVRTVPGRMECFTGVQRPMVVVDYAHTPDALEKALLAVRTHCHRKLWCVFGCGGERDRGKRPQMGAIAERLADQIVITDDNPRHEDGDVIVSEIIAGISDRSRAHVERDRPRALAWALRDAMPDDVVLVAGKGHETYQVFGDDKRPYSDRETVAALLKEARP